MKTTHLAEAALDRIAADEDRIKAYAFIDRDIALAEARRLDAEGIDRPLSGEIVAIKDIFDTEDMPTACGSAIHAGRRTGRDAAAVAAIRAAGGLVIGKSVTTEFAHMTAGPTRHPANIRHTPGGSSSGSAATVAALGATMATGTQTAGSIIRPAAFCGIVGFKPTFGTISRSGLSLFSETLDTIGGFARSVEGAARFVGAMADRPGLISPQRAGPPKLAIWRTPDARLADDAAIAELERVADTAARHGATVTDFAGGLGWSALMHAQKTIMSYEGARSLAWERHAHPGLLSTPLLSYLEEGAKVDGAAWLDAQRLAITEIARLLDEMAGFDAILTLSAHGEAPFASTGTGDPHFNRVWTLVGGPSLHIPTGAGPAGMPLGVQLVGAPQRDEELVGTGLWLETAIA